MSRLSIFGESSRNLREENNARTEYFRKKKEEEKALQENLDMENKSKLLRTTSITVQREAEEREKMVQKENRINEHAEEVAPTLFGSIVYRAIPIDEVQKQGNVDYIYNECINAFNTIVENKSINIQEHGAFGDLLSLVKTKVSHYVNEEKLSFDQVGDIVSSIHDEEKSLIESAVNVIEDKVINVIDYEKKYKNFVDKCNENNVEVKDEKSLYMKISEERLSYVMENMDLSESKKEDIAEMTIVESIISYTILESMNTLKMFNIDFSKLRQKAESI
ncbi:hypothetical protein FPHOBKDP_00220 [Listeria phage LPJP1]|nr:hypothetical protein FPHOBKDP_00220 [Listeria phage LPJP1]